MFKAIHFFDRHFRSLPERFKQIRFLSSFTDFLGYSFSLLNIDVHQGTVQKTAFIFIKHFRLFPVPVQQTLY